MSLTLLYVPQFRRRVRQDDDGEVNGRGSPVSAAIFRLERANASAAQHAEGGGPCRLPGWAQQGARAPWDFCVYTQALQGEMGPLTAGCRLEGKLLFFRRSGGSKININVYEFPPLACQGPAFFLWRLSPAALPPARAPATKMMMVLFLLGRHLLWRRLLLRPCFGFEDLI